MKNHQSVQNCVLCFTLSWTSLDMSVLQLCTLILPESDSKPFQLSVCGDVRAVAQKKCKSCQKLQHVLRDQGYSTTKASSCNYLANSARRYDEITMRYAHYVASQERNSRGALILHCLTRKDRSVLAHSQRPSFGCRWAISSTMLWPISRKFNRDPGIRLNRAEYSYCKSNECCIDILLECKKSEEQMKTVLHFSNAIAIIAIPSIPFASRCHSRIFPCASAKIKSKARQVASATNCGHSHMQCFQRPTRSASFCHFVPSKKSDLPFIRFWNLKICGSPPLQRSSKWKVMKDFSAYYSSPFRHFNCWNVPCIPR